jgi:hypothetical protein
MMIIVPFLVFFAVVIVAVLLLNKPFCKQLLVKFRGRTDEIMRQDASTPEGAKDYYNAAIREKEEFYNNPLVKTIVKLVNTNNGEYTGKVSEIISSSTYFGTRIYKNAQCTGRDISKIAPLLEKYYSITHYAPNKGTASVPHTFRKLV